MRVAIVQGTVVEDVILAKQVVAPSMSGTSTFHAIFRNPLSSLGYNPSCSGLSPALKERHLEGEGRRGQESQLSAAPTLCVLEFRLILGMFDVTI